MRPSRDAEQNWQELNMLFLKGRMNITMGARMVSHPTGLRMDRNTGRASPDPCDRGDPAVKGR